MLKHLENIFIKERPDLVLTYGDTNSSLAASLSASKLNFPLAHVEAGVRGFDKGVPEEINRLIIDSVSELLFCPTKNAVNNLKNEGIENGVFFTGDLMAEVLREKIKNVSFRMTGKKGGYALATLHRQENVDRKENLKEIINAFSAFKGQLIFPVHPRTKKNLKRFGLWDNLARTGSVELLEPQGYPDFLILQKNASRILTDSGGVQKEAYILKVPCLTVRTTTEWPETLEGGWNRLVPCKCSAILNALNSRIVPGGYKDVFKGGKASYKIFSIIKSWFQKR
jgi:UDP-N-acetylglucosamine 2-epimerase (non-hydrolysing)